MVERVKLIAAQQELPLEPKVARVKLLAAAGGGSAAENDAVVKALHKTLQEHFPEGAASLALGPALSEWIQGPPPPVSGFWEYRIRGTSEQGVLWCTTGDARFLTVDGEELRPDGIWTQGGPLGLVVCMHSTVAGTMEYRGLAQPNPEGYLWEVPGARRARVKLER